MEGLKLCDLQVEEPIQSLELSEEHNQSIAQRGVSEFGELLPEIEMHGRHHHDSDHDPLDLFDISSWNPNEQGQAMDSDGSRTRFYQQGRVPFVTKMPSTDKDDDTAASRSANTVNTVINMRKNVIPTITTIYEPKFYEIYRSYQTYLDVHHPEINNSNSTQQHLMTLCLNNLLAFSQWSREPASNAQWIRTSLFENPDMRPEVRNGLALILVYTFSSAKSMELIESMGDSAPGHMDMFTVLMKNDSGLGIVNKTSLKIYSDPYGYFNFIKACISGLIDAQAIPENERLNAQVTKKSRRGSRNRDEVEAWEYIRTSLVAMFQAPDMLNSARERIAQIMAFWQAKGKTIRNERFSSLFQLPTAPPKPVESKYMHVDTSNAPMPPTSSGRQPRTSRSSVETNFAFSNSKPDNGDRDSDSGSDTISSSSRSPHPSLYDSFGRRMPMRLSNASNASNAMPELPMSSLPVPALRFDRTGTHRWNAVQAFLYDLDALKSAHVTFYLVDEDKLKTFFREMALSGGEDNLMQLVLSPAQAASGLSSLEKVLQRANAVLTSWNHSDFAQLRSFVESWRYKCSRKKSRTLSSSGNEGVRSPQPQPDLPDSHRIMRRRTTTGADLKRDLARLQQLHELNNGAISDLHLSNPVPGPPGPDSYSPSAGRKEDDEENTLINYWHSLRGQANLSRSKGLLVYERSTEVGLIVRANKNLGIFEDVWCLYYPEDALQYFATQATSAFGQQNLNSSFAAFLFQLLPQTRVLMRYLRTDQAVASPWGVDPDQPIITIGYYAHAADANSAAQLGPPPAPTSAFQYRTIGTLDQTFHQLISR